MMPRRLASGVIEPCLPSRAKHEIKHDGFRIMAPREGIPCHQFDHDPPAAW
jgi:hypothetical protein